MHCEGGVAERECGELILGIETSCDDTGAAVVMRRFLCLCIPFGAHFDDLVWVKLVENLFEFVRGSRSGGGYESIDLIYHTGWPG